MPIPVRHASLSGDILPGKADASHWDEAHSIAEATQAQAEAGTNNDVAMTPLRTRQAIVAERVANATPTTQAQLDADGNNSALTTGRWYYLSDVSKLALAVSVDDYVAFDAVLREGVPTATGRHIFTLAGDSLIGGRGADNNHANRDVALDPIITENAKQYVLQPNHPQGDTWIDGISPIYGLDPAYVEDRIYFAESMLPEYTRLSGKLTGVIAVSNGGSSLTGQAGWKPTEPYGTNLLEATSAHNAGWLAITNDEPDAVMGSVIVRLTSNFNDETFEQLVQAWVDLCDYMRANWLGVTADTPIIIGGPAFGGTSGSERRSAAAEAAAKRVNVYVQHPVYPTQAADNLHPTRAENRQDGINLAGVAYMANYGNQAEPTITNNTSQGAIVGQPFTLNVQHTGLAGDDTYGTVRLTGNDDDALFEVAGTLKAPQIVEVTPGTLAAGAHTFTAQVEDQEGQLGPAFICTVTVNAAGGVDVDTVYRQQLAIDDTVYAEISMRTVPIYKGLNIFVQRMNGSNKAAQSNLTIDGNPATILFAYDGTNSGNASNGAGNWIVWGFESGIDTTADLIRYDASSSAIGSGFKMWHLSAAGGSLNVGDTEYLFSTSYAGGTPFGTKAFVVPDGDQLLTFAEVSNTVAVESGTLIQDAGSNNLFIGRKTDGQVRLSAGANRSVTFTSLVLQKAT